MVATIISVIVSAIIAFFIAKWQMKKNQIDHYFINSYDIGKGLTEDFPDFALHYKDEVLSENVKVLKGGFMNTGRNDIGDYDRHTDIKLILPEGYVVKAIKLSIEENGLIIKSNIDVEKRNIIIFSIEGLFKPKEYFDYLIIIEVPENVGDKEDTGVLEKELKFEHRILNTKKEIRNIIIGSFPEEKSSKRTIRWIVLFFYIFYNVIVIAWFISLLNNPFVRIINDIRWGPVLAIIIIIVQTIISSLPAFFIRRNRIIRIKSKKQNK